MLLRHVFIGRVHLGGAFTGRVVGVTIVAGSSPAITCIQEERPSWPLVDRRQHRARFRLCRCAIALRPSMASTQTQRMAGIDLACAVGAHAAAGAVAHLLGAIGRAGHAGRGQHALAAHAAIEHQFLGDTLDRRQQALAARAADQARRAVEIGQRAGEAVIDALQPGGVAHAPMSQRLHLAPFGFCRRRH